MFRSHWFGSSKGRNTTRAARPRRRFRPLLEALEKRELLSSSIPLSSTTWTDIGPAPVNQPPNLSGGGGGFGAVSGRVTGLAADPNNANILYEAAAGRGIWKTTNGGTSWTPLTDNLTDSNGKPVP